MFLAHSIVPPTSSIIYVSSSAAVNVYSVSNTYDFEGSSKALLLGRCAVVLSMACSAVGQTTVGVGTLDGAVSGVQLLLSLLDEGLDGLDELALVTLFLLLSEEALDVLSECMSTGDWTRKLNRHTSRIILVRGTTRLLASSVAVVSELIWKITGMSYRS